MLLGLQETSSELNQCFFQAWYGMDGDFGSWENIERNFVKKDP